MKTVVIPPFIIDTREQEPFDFEHDSIIGTLKTGDYSIQGMEEKVVVERKRHTEFISCLAKGRARFQREIIRGEEFYRFHVVVEVSFKQVIMGLYDSYPSQMHLNAIIGTIAAWQDRYHSLRFWFPGDRQLAQEFTEKLLIRTWKDFNKKEKKENSPK